MGDFEIFKHYITQLYQHPAWKLVAGCLAAVIKLMYGPVLRPAYGIVLLLWLVDTATGFYHAWANPALILESRRMYHGLVKLGVYYLLLFLGYQCGQLVLTTFLQGIIEGAILLTESYSILENIEKITTLKQMDIPVLKTVMRWLKGKLAEMNGGKEL